MAFTISEATDVNTLLQWVLQLEGPGGGYVTGDKARTAARSLADKAGKTLGAGLSASDIKDSDFTDEVAAAVPTDEEWAKDAPGPLTAEQRDEAVDKVASELANADLSGAEAFSGGAPESEEDDEAAAIEAAEAAAAAEASQDG